MAITNINAFDLGGSGDVKPQLVTTDVYAYNEHTASLKDIPPVVASSNTIKSAGGRVINLFKHQDDLARPYYAESVVKGNLDIKTNGSWCVNPPSSRTGIIPIIFTEYQPEFSNLVTTLAKTISQLSSSKYHGKSDSVSDVEAMFFGYTDNPIANSFLANATNFRYTFPYLSLGAQDFTTSFGDAEEASTNIFKSVGGDMSRMITQRFSMHGASNNSLGFMGALGTAALTNSGQLVKDLMRAVYPAMRPADAQHQFYKGSSPVSWSYNIELSNTLTVEQAQFNKELVELMAHNGGMGNLRNPIIGDGPCIYSVEIPNVRWIPVCKIDVSYEGKGNLMVVNGETMPESYVLTISVTEIFPPLRVITDTYLKRGVALPAINSSPTNLCDILGKGVDSVKNLIGIS